MRGLSVFLLIAYLVSTPFTKQNSVKSESPKLKQVVVWVTDSAGRPVQDLRAEDFLLEANGVSQTIANFDRNPERPVSIVLLIEGGTPTIVDGSISRELGGARIFRHFFEKKGDEISLAASQPFETYDGTSDSLQFDRLLTDQFAIWDATHSSLSRKVPRLGDSMTRALAEVKKLTHPSRALILFSSQAATLDLQEDLAGIRAAEIPIFILNFWNYTRELQDNHPTERGALYFEAINNGAIRALEKKLTRIAEETNGLSEYFTIDQSRPVERIAQFAQRVSTALRGQYLLTYDASKLSDASMSSIRVRLAGAPRPYSLRFRTVSAE